jgi:hypothetical protein
MKLCSFCNYQYPDAASDCMACGRPLSKAPPGEAAQGAAAPQDEGYQMPPGEQTAGEYHRQSAAPPRLELSVERIELGTLRRWKKQRREIVVRNAGGGHLTGRVTTSAPWIKVAPFILDPSLSQQTIEVEIDPRHLHAGYQYSGLISFYTSAKSELIPVSFGLARPLWQDARLLLFAAAAVLVAALVFSIALSVVNLRRSTPEPVAATRPAEDLTVATPSDASVPPPAEATKPQAPALASESPVAAATPSEPGPPPATEGIQPSALLGLTVTNVDGAELWLDNRSQGLLSQNQLKQLRLPAGPHTLRATKEGFVAWERSLNLQANARDNLRVSLEPSGPSAEEIAREQQRQAELLAQQREAELRAAREREEQRQREEAARRETPPPRPREPSPAVGMPLSMSPSIEGKYVMVVLAGRFGELPAPSGSVDVTVSAPESPAALRSVRGNLPGRPCRVSLVAYENVAEHSFAETPGPGNRWARTTVRIRPKDAKGIIRFAINWQVISAAPPQ